MKRKKDLLTGPPINPRTVSSRTSLTDLVDETFLSYNAGRIREACQLFVRKMLHDSVTIGVTLAGALTPAGLGSSCIVPLMEHGYLDWLVTTGANLYHDIHFSLGLPLFRGSHRCDDARLRRAGVVRIYDILFDYRVLLRTDTYLKRLFRTREFNREMGTAELHYLLGKHLSRVEEERGVTGSGVLASAYRCGVPIYAPSPGDSSLGMNLAALALAGGNGLKLDLSLDVNESAALVYNAKQGDCRSGVFICGGGSPKNFILQTEPHIQEILGLSETGHDYFIQITDARPDTGGLSGATPSEAMSWGKVTPEGLPNTVVVYGDTTIVLPLITAYLLRQGIERRQKRLYHRRPEFLSLLRDEYAKRPTTSR